MPTSESRVSVEAFLGRPSPSASLSATAGPFHGQRTPGFVVSPSIFIVRNAHIGKPRVSRGFFGPPIAFGFSFGNCRSVPWPADARVCRVAVDLYRKKCPHRKAACQSRLFWAAHRLRLLFRLLPVRSMASGRLVLSCRVRSAGSRYKPGSGVWCLIYQTLDQSEKTTTHVHRRSGSPST